MPIPKRRIEKFDHVSNAPCSNYLPVPGTPVVTILCVDGFWHLERLVVLIYATAISGNRCYETHVSMYEDFNSGIECDDNATPPEASLWDALMQDYLAFEQSQPRKDIFDLPPAGSAVRPQAPGGCNALNGVKVTYRIECDDGKIKVTRTLTFTYATPLPGGNCYVVRHTVEQPFRTDRDCDPLDPVFPIDAEQLWREEFERRLEGVKTGPLPPPERYALAAPFGDELETLSPFQDAVAIIQAKEAAAGTAPAGYPRWLTITLADGTEVPSIAKLMALRQPGSPLQLVVTLEGSYVEVPVRF